MAPRSTRRVAAGDEQIREAEQQCDPLSAGATAPSQRLLADPRTPPDAGTSLNWRTRSIPSGCKSTLPGQQPDRLDDARLAVSPELPIDSPVALVRRQYRRISSAVARFRSGTSPTP